MPPSLLSQDEVVRWFRGERYWSDLDDFAARLQQWTDASLPEQVVETVDEIHGEGLLAGEEHMLFFVGTLLVQGDQTSLWKAVYDGARGHLREDDDEDELEFLERLTPKARTGKW